MESDTFSGDRKAPMRSPLANLEKRIISSNVGRFPPWIQGYHLTLATIPLSAGLLAFGWLAQFNLHWLWGSSAMFLLQWFTDSFDGALGRLRNTGIPRWGFYMDHLLDFLFMWCAPVAYVFLVSDVSVYLVFSLAFIYSAMMANSFLGFAAINEFKITYLGLGPTEIRIAFVALNTALIIFGPGFLDVGLPFVVAILLGALCVIVYRTQRRIWADDMARKQTAAG
ncbi:MAG: CDP-alcohol phosphatidyltransferase family protein [Planctomycetota bacterium]|jgi:phosphatidylglycerophosphate synthase